MLASGAEQYFGDAGAVIRPIARFERPYSELLRVSVDVGSRQFYAFLKVAKPWKSGSYAKPAQLASHVQSEFDAAVRLHSALRDHPGLAAARPIAVFPEQLAVVTEEAAGRPLDAVLRDVGWRPELPPFLIRVAERTGEWIRTFQEVTAATGELSVSRQRSYIDDRLRYLTSRIIDETDRASALALFDDLAARVTDPSQRYVAIHADLCPANILVTPDGSVTVLDFAMAKSGTRLHDLTHLYLHFEFLKWRPRPFRSFAADLQRSLIRGYDSAESVADPLFRLMLLQHAICHITSLAERMAGRFERPLRAYVRWRWRKCMAMPALALHSSGR